MLLHPHQKLLFIGDSITDAGRSRPSPGATGPSEGLFDPMGRGYVTLVDALLQSVYPHLAIRVQNAGCGGHRITELAGRWQTDVLDHRPDWLSICIGVNDVWRQFDSPRLPEAAVGLEQYESTYRQLLTQTRPLLSGLVLMSPFYIEPSRTDAMRARMDQYGQAVQRLASEFSAIFVNTQSAFDRVLQHVHSSALAWDRVHPNQPGHMILARAFLEGIGFAWDGK
jgi:lysophospholipase L1-like esterase